MKAENYEMNIEFWKTRGRSESVQETIITRKGIDHYIILHICNSADSFELEVSDGQYVSDVTI